MSVTFILHATCPVCGYRNHGLLFTQVRVNKRSLRTTGPGIGTGLWHCQECLHPMDEQLYERRMHLEPGDVARVAAYRRRHGWDQP